MNRDDGLGYLDVCEYNLFLNAEVVKYKKQDPRLYVSTGNNPVYCIGCSETSSSYFRGDVTAIVISKHKYITTNKILKIYRTTKDYLVDNATIKDGIVEGVDFSQTNVIDTNLFDDLIPLQNSVNSINDIRPSVFKRRSVSGKDKDRTFNFNQLSRRYAYVADGGSLIYDYGFGDSWTIMARVYIDSYSDKQYIFDCYDYNDTSNSISLYRDSQTANELCLDFFGNRISTRLSLDNDAWHVVALSYKEVKNNDSLDTKTITYRVYIDGKTYEYGSDTSNHLNHPRMLVGRSISYVRDTSNLGSYDDYMPLCGQIEMLGIRHSYCETSTLNNMANELNGLTKINLYDDFGMLKKKEVINKNEEILSNTYSYKTRSNTKYISKQVTKQVIKTKGSTLTTRNYTLDKLGNLTGILDSYFGSHTYQYENNGNLSYADGITYSYDKNGNILKGNNTYTYDGTIKDRLVKVNDKTITYDSNNPLNPISYNGNTYEYEGRRLIKFNNIKYTYDLEGKRIKKDNNGNITNYYYSGDRLITEINNSYRLDFIYDENGQLIGFIHDSNKYLYIRDVLQNILGIIDINGNVVVKYDCDAFGKINNITGSKASTIGKYNPFRYKGYYYDEESSMYYCKSRYYVHEWCRWLNADSLSFLEPTILNQMNLFTYCSNNPIANIDSNGKFGFLATLLISVAVNVVINLVTEVIEDVSSDGKLGGDKDGMDYLGALAGGAISGLGVGAGTTMLTGGLGSMVDSYISGESDSVEDGLVSFSTGAMSSLIGFGIGKGITLE